MLRFKQLVNVLKPKLPVVFDRSDMAPPRCDKKYPHIWVTGSLTGDDCFCIACWRDISVCGYFLHCDKDGFVLQETRDLIMTGVFLVPDEPLFFTGMTPIWSPDRDDFTPEALQRVFEASEWIAERLKERD